MSCSVQDQPTRPRPIPLQCRLTQQLTQEWPQYRALRQRHASTRFEEQRQLHLPEKHKATVLESTLRMEMNGLEEQADNDKAHDLHWKPLSWLGTIRSSSANDAFDPKPMGHLLILCLHSTKLGLAVPVLSSLPRNHNNQLAKCCFKKHCIDFHDDHTSTCTAHAGATKAHDRLVGVLQPLFIGVLGPLFRTDGHTVRMQQANGRRDVEIRNYMRDQAGSRILVFDLSITLSPP